LKSVSDNVIKLTYAAEGIYRTKELIGVGKWYFTAGNGEISRHLEHYLVSTAYRTGLAHRLTIGTPIAFGRLHGCDHGASDQDETTALADTDT